MQNDESIWDCINHGFCSFKVKVKQPKATFCRNVYNVTGSCNRVSCPLANSQYATVRQEEGVCFLYIKTVERAHTPKNMWEKIKLKKNFAEALQQISDNLLYWPEHMVNRCKQRLTKMRQMIMRQRKLALRGGPKLVPIKKKLDRREAIREDKAETAAKLDLAIEEELLQRLKQGTYGELYNLDEKKFADMLDDENLDVEEEMEEEEEEEELGRQFVEDFNESESEMEDGVSEPPKKAHKKARLEVEYEMEDEPRRKALA
eukprot:GEMP01080635.1.p2 GENE.GEMP01080635.1~~GEMP01080635.1.p2  ORF type:complete len:260 (+),score=70.26 GEMP01080635.1:195-974(+)